MYKNPFTVIIAMRRYSQPLKNFSFPFLAIDPETELSVDIHYDEDSQPTIWDQYLIIGELTGNH